jgi:P27 family predicted phage terminase small subunit
MPRRPAPTSLKILRGNPGKRALNQHEPIPPADAIQPPSWLKGHALAKWRELVPLLTAVRLLTNVDVGPLARYCDTWSWWRQCREEIQRDGDVMTIRDRHGNPTYHQQHPRVSIANKLASNLTALEREFGLSPAARSTLHVKPETPVDELTAFFENHGA